MTYQHYRVATFDADNSRFVLSDNPHALDVDQEKLEVPTELRSVELADGSVVDMQVCTDQTPYYKDQTRYGWVHFPDGAPKPRPTRQDVNAERDRRLEEDFTFNSVVFQADKTSQQRLEKARVSALAAKASGAQPGDYRWHGRAIDFFWIAKDNSHVNMDADTVIQFGNALAAREGLLIAAADTVKALEDTADGIPDEFANHPAWPAR